MANKQLAALKANPKNPRKITDAKVKMLRDSVAKFGDLSGIVFNKTSGQVVGGHQRIKAFEALGASDVTLTQIHTGPTSAGTVAEGHVNIDGERFSYREVEWDEHTEKAANLAANKGAGEWDLSQVAQWVDELESVNFDLGLTLFDAHERQVLKGERAAPPSPGKLMDGPEFQMPSEMGQAYGQDQDSALDDGDAGKAQSRCCPACGYRS